ncbi:MAG TPA: tetratricopeptide repeat protein [Actinocrinis sp.]|nr:tetratricopeptide repeat protein [Actinocrinis sp.]
MSAEPAQELLQQLCRDLKLLREQAGGPTLRSLSARLLMGKSQIGAILGGRIRQPPEWEIVRGLVEACRQYARDHDRLDLLSVATGIEEYWRPRYAALSHALRVEYHRQPPADRRPVGAESGAGAGPDTGRALPRWMVPHQLPPPVRHFAGRADELKALSALLDESVSSGASMVTVIGGTAGVGKTSLALHWAHQAADRFPDGQLYINLRGYDPSGAPLDAAEALRVLLDALEVAPERIPAAVEAQAALYRSLLAGRRILTVLDNAHDVEQVVPLLPGAPGCLTLVTSRDRLSGLIARFGAQPIALDLPTPAESWEMLARRLGRERTAAEAGAAQDIISRCGRLPLALAIVAARAAARPRFPLRGLADELRDSRRRLEALTSDHPAADVRAVFSWSYHALSPAAARLFRLLGLHFDPCITQAAAASLAGLSPAQVSPLLAELTRAHLVDESIPGRYVLHDLLGVYASEQAHADDSARERQTATRRVLDHYLHSAHRAALLINPLRDPIALDPLYPAVTPEPLDGYEQAMAWFGVEMRVLIAAVNHAADAGLSTYTGELAWTLADFLHRRGHWHEYAATQRAALSAAQHRADLPAQTVAHRLLARAWTQLGRYDDAHAHLETAIDVARDAGDLALQAHAHHSRAVVWERQGRHADALDQSQQALSLFQAADHPRGQADALNAVGWYHAQLGHQPRALVECRRALALYEQLGDLDGQADAWDSLGYAHHHLGDYMAAADCYVRALDLYRRFGNRYQEASTLARLGDTRQARADFDAARDAWALALAILESLDHPDADSIHAKLDVVAECATCRGP